MRSNLSSGWPRTPLSEDRGAQGRPRRPTCGTRPHELAGAQAHSLHLAATRLLFGGAESTQGRHQHVGDSAESPGTRVTVGGGSTLQASRDSPMQGTKLPMQPARGLPGGAGGARPHRLGPQRVLMEQGAQMCRPPGLGGRRVGQPRRLLPPLGCPGNPNRSPKCPPQSQSAAN